jgi:hypothetical protein
VVGDLNGDTSVEATDYNAVYPVWDIGDIKERGNKK